MTNKQQNKLNMAAAVQQFFRVKQAEFSQNIPIQENLIAFNNCLSQLESHAKTQSTNTKAHTEVKDANRENLMMHLLVYSNKASVYFSDKNSALSGQFKFSRSKLLKLTGLELKTFAENIADLLTTNITELSAQYVTSENLDDLIAKINLFDAKSFDAATAKGNTKNATQQIKNDLRKLTTALQKIDQLMLEYILTDNELYNLYRIARKTSDLGKGPKTVATPPSN